MTAKDLNNFGKLRRTFKGSGFARFSDESEVKASFTLVQLIDTQLMFIADFKRPMWDFLASSVQLIGFSGTLLDGRPVSVQGLVTTENKQTQHGVQVTCTATTTIKNSAEIDTAIDIIETLCDVITVARGTLVCWTSFDVKVIGSEPPYSRYRDSVTRSFVGIELINSTDRQNTKSFLERGFSRCHEISPDFQVRRIARAFTETRTGPFLESRSLLIGVLVEYIASVRARIDERTYFLDRETFESKWGTFKANVKIALIATYPEIAENYLPVILSSIKGLNRRPLSWKLNDLTKWLDVKFEPGEVEKFVTARNNLAHEGKFPEIGTPIEHYQRMQHFIDRVILRLFDYHGPYYDFENREMRQI